MRRFVFSRVVSALTTVLLASFLSFVLLRVAPGDPARLIAGPLANQATVEQVRRDLGVNQPIPTQYWRYASQFLQGDWGFSFSTGEPVRVLIGERLPATLELGLYGFVLAMIPAVAFALLASARRGSAIDRSVRGVAFVGLGTPPFWLALLGLIIGFQVLHVLPGPEGRLSGSVAPPPHFTGLFTLDALLAGQFGTFANALWHLLLPALVLAFPAFAFLVRLLRGNLLDVSREPFLLVTRGKGASRWRVLSRHALPNAFLPTLTSSGIVLAQLLVGSVLVESIFAWPGVGALVVDSVRRQDYAVVQAFVLISALLYVLINLAVDALYGVIDPRTRLPSNV